MSWLTRAGSPNRRQQDDNGLIAENLANARQLLLGVGLPTRETIVVTHSRHVALLAAE